MPRQRKILLAIALLLMLAVAAGYAYRTFSRKQGESPAGTEADTTASGGAAAPSPSGSGTMPDPAAQAGKNADTGQNDASREERRSGSGSDGGGPAGNGEISEYGPVAQTEEETKAVRQPIYKGISLLFSGTAEAEGETGELLRILLEEDGFSLRLSYAGGDAAAQREDLKKDMDSGAEIFLIEPVDPHDAALGELVSELAGRGRIAISYGELLYEAAPLSFHVGYDPYGTGQKEAAQLLDALDIGPGSRANIEIFTGDMEDERIYYSYPGLMEGLFPELSAGRIQVPSGGIEIEETCTFDGAAAEAGARMRSLLGRYYGSRQLDAVVCTDGELARGVCAALREADPENTETLMVAATGDKTLAPELRLSEKSRILYLDGERLAREAEKLLSAVGYGDAAPVNNTTDYDNGAGKIPCLLLEPELMEP